MTKKTNLLICLAIFLNFCCYPILSADILSSNLNVDLTNQDIMKNQDMLKYRDIGFIVCFLFFILWYFISQMWKVIGRYEIAPMSKWKKITKLISSLNKIQAWRYLIGSIILFSTFLIQMFDDSPAQPILAIVGVLFTIVILVITAIFLFLQIKILAILCIELIKYLYFWIRGHIINA
ncbi:MAG: hypothetical protein H6909_04400 [Rickettsiaceae bacterium]|nr:hypothetical protein [Rickettsiaceae bacterium]